MGADAAVERHDGTPPGEDQIAARMRAEGLSPHGWGNAPGHPVRLCRIIDTSKPAPAAAIR
jgi:hypothetical protein